MVTGWRNACAGNKTEGTPGVETKKDMRKKGKTKTYTKPHIRVTKSNFSEVFRVRQNWPHTLSLLRAPQYYQPRAISAHHCIDLDELKMSNAF